MGVRKISVFVAIVVSLTLVVLPCYVQTSPQDYLIAHNTARAEVGVPALVWNPVKESEFPVLLRGVAKECSESGIQASFGFNFKMGDSSLTAADAVNSWVAEKPYYDYESKSCVGGECRRYAQMVWRNFTDVACGTVYCYNGSRYIGCLYYPVGNNFYQHPYYLL